MSRQINSDLAEAIESLDKRVKELSESVSDLYEKQQETHRACHVVCRDLAIRVDDLQEQLDHGILEVDIDLEDLPN